MDFLVKRVCIPRVAVDLRIVFGVPTLPLPMSRPVLLSDRVLDDLDPLAAAAAVDATADSLFLLRLVMGFLSAAVPLLLNSLRLSMGATTLPPLLPPLDDDVSL